MSSPAYLFPMSPRRPPAPLHHCQLSGRPQLWLGLRDFPSSDIHADICTSKPFKLGPKDSLCVSEDSGIEGSTDKPYSKALRIGFETEDICNAFHSTFELWKQKRPATGRGVFEKRSSAILKCKFDDKIEATSAKMYFHYYGQLLHQQNMLQDYIRTGTYFAAVIENHSDFNGRIVVDVGAGSGILSLFAAKAGAKHVYAIEASEMAEYAYRLIAGNPSLGSRITVIKCKVEEVELPEKADILISEPMALFKDGSPPHLVPLPPIGTNCAASFPSQSMSWPGKKLLENLIWLPTVHRAIQSI